MAALAVVSLYLDMPKVHEGKWKSGVILDKRYGKTLPSLSVLQQYAKML
jgi:uncharacterized membrane protein